MNIYIAVDYHGCLHWTHLQSIRDVWFGSGQMAGIVKVHADTMPVTISDCVDLAAAQGLAHVLVVPPPVTDNPSELDDGQCLGVGDVLR